MSQLATITHEASGTEAKVLASAGFNCFSWIVADGKAQRELLFANTEDVDGAVERVRAGIPLMLPFAGRIGGGKFTWQRREYSLPAGDGLGNAIHGFVGKHPWRIIDQDPDSVTGQFHASRDAADVLEFWPGDFRIRVTYTVGDRTLHCAVEIDNPGNSPLPCCFGWHPYFRLPLSDGGTMADTTLTVPTSTILPLEQMLPTGELRTLDDSLPLSHGFRIGDKAFDDPFLLSAAAGNEQIVELRDQATGRTLRQTFASNLHYAVVYTPGDRQSICVEPQTGPPDPFAMSAKGLPNALVTLDPGQSLATHMRLEFA